MTDQHREAGKKGGKALVEKHGIEHMAKIGRKGGTRNKEKPAGYFAHIGRKGGLSRAKAVAAEWDAILGGR